jgi:O-antigen ligase
VIALIILTERDPGASLRMVYVRVSYIVFPLSVIFIKYFPDIGRVYSEMGGALMVSGVAGHKNLLGQTAMILCLVLIWDLIETRDVRTASGRKPGRWVRLLTLGIGLYLMVIARSATAGICFLLGLALLMISGRLARAKDAKRLLMAGTFVIACLLAFEQMYGVSSRISESLDRGAGLSGRDIIWRVVLEQASSPVVGVGFKAFWDTSQADAANRAIGMGHLVSAHNGYIETYVDGGVVGLVLLAGLLWTMGLVAADKLVRGDPIGKLAVVFWPILLVANFTESYFFQIATLWFSALMVLIASPQQHRSSQVAHQGELSRRTDVVGRSHGPYAQDRAPVLSGSRRSRPHAAGNLQQVFIDDGREDRSPFSRSTRDQPSQRHPRLRFPR